MISTLRIVFSIACSLLLINVQVVLGQDYKIVLPGRAQYFLSIPVDSVSFSNSNWNHYSWSLVKVAWMDSSASFAGGTIYFPFHTWRDTAAVPQDDCGLMYGPSWIGREIEELNSGTNWFFDLHGDSIRMETLMPVGSSWIMAALDSGRFAKATIDSITWMTQASIQDSVKCISLQAVDQFGVPVANQPINGFVIRISKSNGLFHGFCIREFPEQIIPVDRIDSVPMLSDSTVYNFDVGDEFEFSGNCSTSWAPRPPGFTYYLITSKSFNAAMDTVSYGRNWVHQELDLSHMPYVNVTTFGHDSVIYPCTSVPYFSAFPEENMRTSLYPAYTMVSSYSVSLDLSGCSTRPYYEEHTGFMNPDPTDSCLHFFIFEPLYYDRTRASGLGETYFHSDLSSQVGPVCTQGLFWYHKGSETCGNFILLTGESELPEKPNLISISPNPAHDDCTIAFVGNEKGEMTLSDLQGRILLRKNYDGNLIKLDLRDFEHGIYLLSIRIGTETFCSKLVKQ